MKNSRKKFIVPALVLVLILAAGLLGVRAYLSHSRATDEALARLIAEQGPWSGEANWVTPSGDGWLVCEYSSPEDRYSRVQAYFQAGEGWKSFELGFLGRFALLNDPVTGDQLYQAEIDFDGSVFTLTEFASFDGGAAALPSEGCSFSPTETPPPF